jgi:hypothetical protein
MNPLLPSAIAMQHFRGQRHYTTTLLAICVQLCRSRYSLQCSGALTNTTGVFWANWISVK